MQPTRACVLVSCAALLSSALLICCGSDEALGPNTTPRGDLIGGERNSNEAGQPSSGATAGTGGTSGNGGTAGSLSLGGDVSHVPIGGEGGSLAQVGGGGSGPEGDPEEMLELCGRLEQKTQRSRADAIAFAKAAYADCDVYWIQRLPIDAGKKLDDFYNDLSVWNYNFWGCGTTPVTTFGLVYETPAISAGDAQKLIDFYVAAVDADVTLSPLEEKEMREALARLSKLVITDSSLEPSKPGSNPKEACHPSTDGGAGGGGAGGAGSEPEPIGGAGGTPSDAAAGGPQ